MAEVTAQDDFPHFDEGGDGEATDGSGDCLSCSSTDECMALQACVRSCTQSAGQYIGRTSQRYTVTEEWKNRKLADEIFASAFYLVIMMVFQCTVHIGLVVYLVSLALLVSLPLSLSLCLSPSLPLSLTLATCLKTGN